MAQPKWKEIANLGDASPLEYGGYFVYVDETGVYEAEAEVLLEPCDDDRKFTIYRFTLDRCTFIDGILSDNKFHPEHSAWFAGSAAEQVERPQDSTYLSNVAETCDIPEANLIRQLCSADPIERAWAYRAIGEYHGWENLDSYPLRLNKREIAERYPQYA